MNAMSCAPGEVCDARVQVAFAKSTSSVIMGHVTLASEHSEVSDDVAPSIEFVMSEFKVSSVAPGVPEAS